MYNKVTYSLLTIGALVLSTAIAYNQPTKANSVTNSTTEINQKNTPENHNLIAQLPQNPYKIGDYYNANAYFKCSVGKATHNKQCPGGIIRRGNGNTSVVVLFPNGYEVQYDFKNGNVTTTYGGKLTWGKDGDDWYIGIDNELFIIIPDAAVNGG